MKVSAKSISAIQEIVTGDKKLSPYRSGPQLVRLFNQFGANDQYGEGFPSRWRYTEDNLHRLNDSPALAAVLREVLDPREFLETDHSQQGAIAYLNSHLKYDGYEVTLKGEQPRIRDLAGASVEFEHPLGGSEDEGHHFIDEQLAKCELKIQEGDYDGAVTNARSLMEAVLMELEVELDGSPPPYDGDLTKLFKRVQKLLNLHPARPDVEGPLKQVLAGLSSIIAGLSGISNKMGDRHVRTYRPGKRHAVLAVNSAKTLANFLFETHRARIDKAD